MPYEKIPEEYDPVALRKVVDQLQRSQQQTEIRLRTENQDMSQDLQEALDQLNKKVTQQAQESDIDKGTGPGTLPVPQELKVKEFITWGFATVRPYYSFKYWGKLRGYEFFGSQNEGFSPEKEDHLQSGIHYGTGTETFKNTYLCTEDPDATYTFILAPGLNNGIRVLENSTRSHSGNVTTATTNKLIDSTADFSDVTIGTHVWNKRLELWAKVSAVTATELTLAAIEIGDDPDIFKTVSDSYLVGAGIIDGYNLSDVLYQCKASGVEWVEGDTWRIHNYPSNRLASIGALATFVKRKGNYYVVARSVGRGDSYSWFTEEAQSTGISSSEDLSEPDFVEPIHSDGETCPIGRISGQPEYGLPVHPTLGIVPWDDITGGCRETDHFKFFGIEWCSVEIVVNTIPEDDETIDVFYPVRRTGAELADPDTDDEEEAEFS